MNIVSFQNVAEREKNFQDVRQLDRQNDSQVCGRTWTIVILVHHKQDLQQKKNMFLLGMNELD
jgi:hypothetical protein